MVSKEKQGFSEAMHWADIVAQTVTYERGPFTRQP
jgi:hypothetical protein